MRNFISGVAVGISFSVIAFQLFLMGYFDSTIASFNHRNTTATARSLEIGLDAGGNLTYCDEYGVAMDFKKSNGIMSYETRFNNSDVIRCMTKNEAVQHMKLLGATQPDVEEIMKYYPNLD